MSRLAYDQALDALNHGKFVALIPGTHQGDMCVFVHSWPENRRSRRWSRSDDDHTRAQIALGAVTVARMEAIDMGVTLT